MRGRERGRAIRDAIAAIEAEGYTVRFVEWCEDAETPGMILGYYAGITDHTNRKVKVRTTRATGAQILATLLHELEHVRGAEYGTDHPDLGLRCGGRIGAF